jgi:hypothetical protein
MEENKKEIRVDGIKFNPVEWKEAIDDGIWYYLDLLLSLVGYEIVLSVTTENKDFFMFEKMCKLDDEEGNDATLEFFTGPYVMKINSALNIFGYCMGIFDDSDHHTVLRLAKSEIMGSLSVKEFPTFAYRKIVDYLKENIDTISKDVDKDTHLP